MGTRHHRKFHLAQNFLTSPRLVCRLVGMSNIGPSDTVYEIGPGNGIITAELARTAAWVIAIEKDGRYVRRLREQFRAYGNVEIVEKDFLEYSFNRARERPDIEPSMAVGLQTRVSESKIFANIPYNATTAIMRKILYERPAPSEAYLIVQKEAAKRFSGRPRENMFSVLAKPFFEFDILSHLRRTDFRPAPNVDSVLLSIKRRPVPLLKSCESKLYRDFVHYGFSRWKPNLRLAFKHVFSYNQWKRMARDLSFPLNACATELSFEQWLGLYRGFRRLNCSPVQSGPVSRANTDR